MGKWFLQFLGHELTQFLEYYLGLFSKHPINGENKHRKVFLLLMTVLTMLVLSSLFPLINKTAHWLLFVGITVGIPKSDFNDGISMTFPDPPN